MKVVCLIAKKPVSCIASRPLVGKVVENEKGSKRVVMHENVFARWTVTAPDGSSSTGDTIHEATDGIK